MRTAEDVEKYLIEARYPYEKITEEIWRVADDVDDIDNIFLSFTGNVLTFQVKLFELPKGDNAALLRRMLEMNNSDLVHGAFSIAGQDVFLIESLELDNLDKNELQATIEGIGFGIRLTHSELSELLKNA